MALSIRPTGLLPLLRIQAATSSATLHNLAGHGELSSRLRRLDLSQDLGNRGGSVAQPLTASFAPFPGGRFLLGSRRWGFPRGYKGHKPRYYWDPEDLAAKTKTYTHKPFHVRKQGGRDPATGKRVNQHCGGGVKWEYIMVDGFRSGPSGPGAYYAERVLEVRRHPTETAYLALVAGTKGKRWILATEGLEAGHIIKSTTHIPPIPIAGESGDAHPVGALAEGVRICCVEGRPGEGTAFMKQAGQAATIVRRQDGLVVVQTNSKKEFGLLPTCMAVVGQLSHKDWAAKDWGSANMHRRFGYKQSSGLWHRKDRYSGRRYWPLPPMKVAHRRRALSRVGMGPGFEKLTEPAPEPPELYKVTLRPSDHDCRFGNAKTNPFHLEGLELKGIYEDM